MNVRACYLLATGVVAADQVSKLAALTWLQAYVPVPVLPGFNLTLLFNTGAAFSFLHDASGWQRWGFSVLALGVSVGIALYLPRVARHDPLGAWSLALILGGAVGNLVDRVRLGHVVDFIDLYVAGWHWPAFNLADSAITLGAVGLAVGAFRTPRASGRPAG